ncbi:MAG: hypothetical protein AB7F59_09280 [Bdellovibrionales bacterium]
MNTPVSEFERDSAEPEQQTFSEGYESVWRAVQLAVAEYPIKISNQDSGILETEFIKGDQGWKKPGQARPPSGGRRYKINIRVFKAQGQEETRVVVAKYADVKKNFFSEVKTLPSDGLEELSIMYRIERELNIEKARRTNNQDDSLDID